MKEMKTYMNEKQPSDLSDLSGARGSPPTGSMSTPSVIKDAPKEVAPRRAAGVIESEPEPAVNKTRRRIVWASIAGFLATSFLMFLRFFLPRAIFEPSSVIRIGFPNDYGIGIDEKYKMTHRIWIDRTSDRLFVIFARCTHLGCTPDWKPSETNSNAHATAAATISRVLTLKGRRHARWIVAMSSLTPRVRSWTQAGCTNSQRAKEASSTILGRFFQS